MFANQIVPESKGSGRIARTRFQWVLKLSLLLLAAMVLAPLSASARTYFVSRVAPGPRHDGLTWQTAFNEMEQLGYVALRPGDRVEIDGGATQMAYRTPLHIFADGTAAAPIVIRNSAAAGRTGRVLFVGDNQWGGTGIELNGNYIHMVGSRWSAFRVANYDVGVKLWRGRSVRFSNAEIDHCRSVGLWMYGTVTVANQLIIHHNYTNVIISTYETELSRLTRCWIFNGDNAPWNYGISINNGMGWNPSTTQPQVVAQNCIIGPGLGESASGMDFGDYTPRVPRVSTTMTLQDCLLVNPIETNFDRTIKIKINLNNVTSFLTPLNNRGESHSCLDVYNNDTAVNNSIFYGGVVNVKFKALAAGFNAQEVQESQAVGFRQLGVGNVQFKTSGQTILLGPDQIDPRFVTNVAAIPNNALPSSMYRIDLRHAVAPAAGSRMTSLTQLTSANLP